MIRRHSIVSLLLFLFALLHCGCGAPRFAGELSERRDSVRIEVRTEYIERIDTAWVDVPREADRVVVPDSSSVLENDYALSRALILPGGGLYHSLETKPGPFPVPFVSKEINRDSVIDRTSRDSENVTTEVVRPLSRFTKVQIWGFWALLGLVVLYIFIKIKF